MMQFLRRLCFGAVVVLLMWGIGEAAVSVSPVIVEATGVQKGQSFEILCENWSDEVLSLDLSLALFDRDEEGRVIFHEDEEARHKAREILKLDEEEVFLEPAGQSPVRIVLTRHDFDHLYAVLFVRPKQGGVPTRFAVLLLLSTSEEKTDVFQSSWIQQGKVFYPTVHDKRLNPDHCQGQCGLFRTNRFFCSIPPLKNGVALAGRRRGVGLSLPQGVQRVQVFPRNPGQSL
jgi:hypothetical protein